MKRKAFTLIELIVTIGIATLLTLVALPHYNQFIHNQDIAGEAQKLTECIQQAQQHAAAPPTQLIYVGSLRYGLVRITSDSTGISCSSNDYPDSLDITTLNSTTALASATFSNPAIVVAPVTTSVPALSLCSVKVPSDNPPTVRNTPSNFVMAFDERINGKIAAINPYSKSIGYNQGLGVILTVADRANNGCSSSNTFQINIPALGVPITVQ